MHTEQNQVMHSFATETLRNGHDQAHYIHYFICILSNVSRKQNHFKIKLKEGGQLSSQKMHFSAD